MLQDNDPLRPRVTLQGFGVTRRPVPGGVLLEYERVRSTQDTARERLKAGEAGLIGVRAEYQSAGRGRLGTPWLAPPGACLLVTYVIPMEVGAPHDPRRLAFSAAVAAAEAVEAEAEVTVGLKWPNDLLVNGRKLAGILVETVPEGPALVGIGLNVNIDAFPPELRDYATSLEIETGLLSDVKSLEAAVRTRLLECVRWEWDRLLAAWRARDVTAGTSFLAATEAGEVEGEAIGVSDYGALRLKTDTGIVETVSATSIREGS